MVVGFPAEPADFPYQVQILYKGNFLCSGTVLTTYLILTAAHCFKETTSYDNAYRRYRRIKVRRTKGSPEIGLAGPPILHDSFDVEYRSWQYDIALLELSDHLTDVSPGILSQREMYRPSGHVNDWTNSLITISGWGASTGQTIAGIDFIAAHLPIGHLLDCQTDRAGAMPEKTFCSRAKGIVVCRGDSGGPATCGFSYDVDDEARTKNLVCGIISNVDSGPCGQTNIAKQSVVYTDVSQYTDWIVKKSCPIRTYRNSTPSAVNDFVCCNMFSIAKEYECDGFEDCLDGSDEANCFWNEAHKQCLPTEELCAKARVTYTVLAPTFVYPRSQYQIYIFLERAATNLQYTFKAWFIDGNDSWNSVTIQDGDHGTITIWVDNLIKSAYTLVVEAVDPLDDSAFYLRQTISVGQSGRTMLFTDKDVYEIGEFVHLTAVLLDPEVRISDYSNVYISVKDSQDNLIWKYYHRDVSKAPALISYRFPVAPHGNRGNWSVYLSRYEDFKEPLITNMTKTFVFTGSKFILLPDQDSINHISRSTNTAKLTIPTISTTTNPHFSDGTKRLLKAKLLNLPTNQIKQDCSLEIQVETSDAVNVAHLIIYSAGEVLFAKSYQPTNPRKFTIDVHCPKEIWREAKLVVFGYIRGTFVSDELDLKVVNWTQKTNDNLGLYVSVDKIEVEKKITIFIQAEPGSNVYLHAEDAAFEDPDEFATEKWLNEVLKPSRTPHLASSLWGNFKELRRLELEVLTNAPPQNPLESQASFDDEVQKVTNTGRKIWLSQTIEITNSTTELEFTTPSIQGEWKIKGFVIIQEPEMRRFEMLPTASLSTVATVQPPPFVNHNETLKIPFVSENSSEIVNIPMANVRPIWRNKTVRAGLTELPSSDLMSLFADTVDDFASAYVSGSSDSNLLRMTANAAILNYWRAANMEEELVWKKGIESLQITYQNQLALKRPDGSFAKFANSSSNSSVWRTAWTIQAFVAAEKFIFIDPSVIKGGLSFLSSNLTGLLNIDTRKSTKGMSLTAFTLVALIEASRHCDCSDSIQWAREYLQRSFMADDASLYGKTLAAYAEQVFEANHRFRTSNLTEYLTNLNFSQRGNDSVHTAQFQKLSPGLKMEIHSFNTLMHYYSNVDPQYDFTADKLLKQLVSPLGSVSAHATAVAISTLAKIATMELNFPNQVKIFYGSTYICSGAVLAPYLILTNANCFEDVGISRIDNYLNISVVATHNRIRIGLRQPPILQFRNENNIALLELNQDLRHVQPVILSSTPVYDADKDNNAGEGMKGIVTRQSSGEFLDGNVLRMENLTLLNVTTCWGPYFSSLSSWFCAHGEFLCIEGRGELTSCWINYINTKSLESTKAVKKVFCGLHSGCGNHIYVGSVGIYTDIPKFTKWILQKSHQIRNERGGNCGAHEFQCRNKFCIPKDSECDGYPDCLDGSDEQKCSILPSSSAYNKTFCAWHKAARGGVNETKSQEVCFRFIPISVGTLLYDMVLKSNDIDSNEIFRRQQILLETGHQSFVYSDKSFYFADDMIHFGAVLLDIPASDSVIRIDIRILDSRNKIIWQDQKNSSSEIEQGFISHEVPASSGNSGTWKIIMRRQENSTGMEPVDTTFEKKIDVQNIPRPRFQVLAWFQNSTIIRSGDVFVRALPEDGTSGVVGRCEIKFRVFDEWGRYLSKELLFVYPINTLLIRNIDFREFTREYPNGGLVEMKATVTDNTTGQALTDFAWARFFHTRQNIQEINSHRVRRPGLPYHAEFRIVDSKQQLGIIASSDKQLETTPNAQHTSVVNGTFILKIDASALSTDEYFQINYTNASFAQNVPRIGSAAKDFLQIRLLSGSDTNIYRNSELQIHVMTTDVVDVLHMIVHSDGEIVSYRSYVTNNTREYVIETRCPKEVGREATIVVFTDINNTSVSDAIHFNVKDWNKNSIGDIDFTVSRSLSRPGENLTISVTAWPGTFVYLQVEDARYEYPDEFASKTWLIQSLLQVSRTNESEKESKFMNSLQLDLSVLNNAWNRHTYSQADFEQFKWLDLSILKNAGYLNRFEKSHWDFNRNMTNMKMRNQRVLYSKMIQITNEYGTHVDILVPSLHSSYTWAIKGYCVLKDSLKFRRIEILPTKFVTTLGADLTRVTSDSNYL